VGLRSRPTARPDVIDKNESPSNHRDSFLPMPSGRRRRCAAHVEPIGVSFLRFGRQEHQGFPGSVSVPQLLRL